MQPNEVAQELKPNEQQAAPRVATGAVRRFCEDPGGEVVLDLRALFGVQLFGERVGLALLQGVQNDVIPLEECAMAVEELDEGLLAALAVRAPFRGELAAPGRVP